MLKEIPPEYHKKWSTACSKEFKQLFLQIKIEWINKFLYKSINIDMMNIYK
jgi:hypothetical protein